MGHAGVASIDGSSDSDVIEPSSAAGSDQRARDDRILWTITPELTPIFLGSGYAAGAYFFWLLLLYRRMEAQRSRVTSTT